MRIIKNIDEQIKCIDPSFNSDQAPTYKKILLDCLLGAQENGERIVRAMKLGLYIYDSKGDLPIQDDNFRFLWDHVLANPLKYPNFAVGDCLERMRKAEKKL